MRTWCRVAAAFVVTVAMTASIPAGQAHEASLRDADDTAGPLDIATASVRHQSSAVLHTIVTRSAWNAATLGDDSYFAILLDLGGTKRSFEACAFVVAYRGKLYGVLTNCGKTYKGDLRVTRSSDHDVTIRISEAWLRGGYRWAAGSYYTAPGACHTTCVDSAPDSFPLPVHDLTKPTVHLTTPGLVSDGQTAPAFQVTGDVFDRGGAKLEAWSMREAAVPGGSSGDVLTGTSPASIAYDVSAPGEGITYTYTVAASDTQGNRTTKRATTTVPWDDSSGAFPGTFEGSWTTTSPGDAYLGTLHTAGADGDSVTFAVTAPAHRVTTFVWIGPGMGNWTAKVSVATGVGTRKYAVSAIDAPDLPRQRLFQTTPFAPGVALDVTITITVPAGGGSVPVDAFAAIITKR